MGNCFSDPSSSAKQSGGQRLGSGPASTGGAGAASGGTGATGATGGTTGSAGSKRNNAPPQRLGGPVPSNGVQGVGGVGESEGEARDRALRAAEERAKAAGVKGVNTANPKAGQLSKKLADERRVTPTSPQPDERMMDRGQWN